MSKTKSKPQITPSDIYEYTQDCLEKFSEHIDMLQKQHYEKEINDIDYAYEMLHAITRLSTCTSEIVHDMMDQMVTDECEECAQMGGTIQ